MHQAGWVIYLLLFTIHGATQTLHAQSQHEDRESGRRAIRIADPPDSSRDSSARVLYRGPHGGQFFLNKMGERVYVGSEGLEATPERDGEGHVIFTGPKGGKYYFDENGRKVYIKKRKPEKPGGGKQPGK